MPAHRYHAADPYTLERLVADDIAAALWLRGALVRHVGGGNNPDIVVEGPGFNIVVEVAKRVGASAASEFSSIREHRDTVEDDTARPTHLLFTCLRTPARIITDMRAWNEARERDGRPGRMLFLNLEALDLVLRRLHESPDALYPLDRWPDWFAGWRDVGDDAVALERLHATVLAEDTTLGETLAAMVERRTQAEQERLRKDIQKLENVLRQTHVTGNDAMKTLVYVMFAKLYEEKHESDTRPNRFTVAGFPRYREGLPPAIKRDWANRTLHYLLGEDINADPEIETTGVLRGLALSDRLTDRFVQDKLLPVLERYRFRGTHVDALGAVFEAVARRGEKDVRIGQFFTPEPIVHFAVDLVDPSPTETVLDPAGGTARFLTTAMEHMIARADRVAHTPREDVIRGIKRQQMLGTEIDPWVVTIAKMNMYIHEDGKSTIEHQNGLVLADVPVFTPFGAAGPLPPLDGLVDACLTNPPLGLVDFREAGEAILRSHPEIIPGLIPHLAGELNEAIRLAQAETPLATADAAARRRGTRRIEDAQKRLRRRATDAWVRRRLPVVPGYWVEERQIAAWDAQIRVHNEAIREAIRGNDARAERAATRRREELERRRLRAQERLARGEGTWEVEADALKGGALFLAAIHAYLKPLRDPSAVAEWQGGRLGIVVDEAILNTPDYAATRAFVREHYYVKAVVSFGRDAFWYQARTTAKTSLLYLVRKRETRFRQREPIFFAHVERIGLTRTGQPDASDLPATLAAYRAVEAAITASYGGPARASFDEGAARRAVAALTLPETVQVRWQTDVPDGEPGARLDYAAEAARQIRAALPSTTRTLGDYVRNAVREPPEDPDGIYAFATVDRNTGAVSVGERTPTSYEPRDLRLPQVGDILASGIDLVHGAVGYVREDPEGAVVSKEYYTLELRPERSGEADARYLALLLRTPKARQMVAGDVTGTSNRTRVESPEALLRMPLPPLPPLADQVAAAQAVDDALDAARRASEAIDATLDATDAAWTAEHSGRAT